MVFSENALIFHLPLKRSCALPLRNRSGADRIHAVRAEAEPPQLGLCHRTLTPHARLLPA